MDEGKGLVELICTWNTQNSSCPLDYSQLETKTNAQKWNFLFSSVFDCQEHASRSSKTKSAWDENSTGKSDVRKRFGNFKDPSRTQHQQQISMHHDTWPGSILASQVPDLKILPTVIVSFRQKTTIKEYE